MLKRLWGNLFPTYLSFGERLLGVFTLLVILVAFCVMALLGFLAVDTIGVEATNSVTTVIEVKKVRPSYTTIIVVGKAVVPQFHPTSYWLQFKIDGTVIETSVEKQFYDDVIVGSTIWVDYGVTRLSHSYKTTNITN